MTMCATTGVLAPPLLFVHTAATASTVGIEPSPPAATPVALRMMGCARTEALRHPRPPVPTELIVVRVFVLPHCSHLLTASFSLNNMAADCGNRPNQDQDCVNTCPYSFDGVCDDGGNFSSSSVCAFGTDCGDCGSRGAVLCSDTCKTAANGYCHDGGTGSGGSDCAYGTDCTDCGVRVPLQSVSGAPGAVLSLQSGRGLLTAKAKCTSVKDCSGKGWCNTTIGVCHCGAGYTGPTCAELLPAVSSPMTQCLYGNCTPAKGLVACPQLNNKMVCAANASHVSDQLPSSPPLRLIHYGVVSYVSFQGIPRHCIRCVFIGCGTTCCPHWPFSIQLLKLDGDVGLQLNHYFWAKGGGECFCRGCWQLKGVACLSASFAAEGV